MKRVVFTNLQKQAEVIVTRPGLRLPKRLPDTQ
jgi:hypothetical protein